MNKFIVACLMFLAISYLNSVDWGKAQWICQQQDGPANIWVAFRKTINLDELPGLAMTKLSPVTKYW